MRARKFVLRARKTERSELLAVNPGINQYEARFGNKGKMKLFSPEKLTDIYFSVFFARYLLFATNFFRNVKTPLKFSLRKELDNFLI